MPHTDRSARTAIRNDFGIAEPGRSTKASPRTGATMATTSLTTSRSTGRRLAPTRGKMHVYAGDMDNHYLNLAVYLMEQEASKLKNPEANFTFKYGRPMKPHGWQPMTNAELVRMMERFRAEHRVQP